MNATRRTAQTSDRSISKAPTGPITLLIGTRKGGFMVRSDGSRRTWTVSKPLFLGHTVHHLVADPRENRVLLMAARTGHLGPTVFRSTDSGKSWKESTQPPAFRKAHGGQKGFVVDHVFWLSPSHADERNVWYAGTSPQGLFRSEDGGQTWAGVAGFNDHPMRAAWTGGEQDGTPDGPKLHSILVDPRDACHLYIGMSSGGVFESTDRGKDWRPLNKGCRADFLPMPNPEYGHDPHCVRLHPLNPDRLYQQNHCGIYRMDRPNDQWVRVGENMPQQIGDIGFPMVLHPRDPNTVWVFPMEGSSVWPRVSPGGKPAVFTTRNAGDTWRRQDKGLPRNNAWWTVKRQAMTADAHEPVGLYFGTTSGELWSSRNGGDAWTCLLRHLPEIYSLEAIEH
jgi:photosystem II stability/assembly factor-like uncharacterized protein